MPHRDRMLCMKYLPSVQGRLTPVWMAALHCQMAPLYCQMAPLYCQMAPLYCQKWGLETVADPAQGPWIAGPAHEQENKKRYIC
jgi:hypothetical protein